MRRVLVAMLLVSSLVGFSSPVQAHKGHARPQITRFEFTERPLRSGTLERLIVVAHDPNSWISEIQVQWEDPDQSGGVIFAHTYCVQDPEFTTPGTPAKLKLDLEFDHPANYHVEVRAISQKRCEGGNDTRFSKTLEKDVVVKGPTETFTDPDDIVGPLDVVAASHSQYADEATYATRLVHGLTFSGNLGASPLTGADDNIEYFFDTDNNGADFERILTVDAGPDGTLAAEMVNASGEVVGEATVTVDGSSLSVDFFKRLLGRGIDRYSWKAVTHDSSSPSCTQSACEDSAPSEQLYTHNL